MKIATMATGGIGGFLAVKLTQTGHRVATIARGAHLGAIRENGLTLEGPGGGETVRPWIATDNPAGVGQVDAVIFGVKGDALDAAAEACRPMLGPNTVVVPFLNGVEAADRLAAILPGGNVGNGLAQVSTTIAGPGLIRQTGEFARFSLAERDSRPSERIGRLQDAIRETGSEAPVVDDVECDVWMKFIFFAALSGVTAAGRCTLQMVRGNDALSRLFRDVIAETAALARARGVAIPGDAEEITWNLVNSLPGGMRASTAIDLERGRPLEIDWVTGAVVRLSRAIGLDAPLNSTIYALLSPYKTPPA